MKRRFFWFSMALANMKYGKEFERLTIYIHYDKKCYKIERYEITRLKKVDRRPILRFFL